MKPTLLLHPPAERLRAIRSWSEGGRRAIEARLPPRLRGTGEGYQQMLDAIALRVSVSGIRGKSGLTMLVASALRERGFRTYAKQTGTDPISYLNGEAFPIDRMGNKVKLDETMWELKKFFPFDAAVVENQAIGEYTMRTFNSCHVRPHYLLITNIRRDHQGDIHRELPGLARAFGRSVNPGVTLICGEPREDLASVVREHAESMGARFVSAAVPGEQYVPGIESVQILDALLEDALDRGLHPGERARLVDGLRERFRWRASSRPGLRWFHGAEINDIDSTAAILRHLTRRDPGPVSFIAYFRDDRRDRTASFLRFLEEAFRVGLAERLYASGSGAEVVTRRLVRRGFPVTLLPDDPRQAPEVVDLVARESRSGRVMTIVNAVPPWPRRIAQELELVEHKEIE